MAETREISEIFEDAKGSQKAEELEALTYQLECIVKADTRLLYDENGIMISPYTWPDELAYSVKKVTPHSSGGFVVDFHDKRSAVETLAKLKGLHDSEDGEMNPLESALSKVPREDLVAIAKMLENLSREQADELDLDEIRGGLKPEVSEKKVEIEQPKAEEPEEDVGTDKDEFDPGF